MTSLRKKLRSQKGMSLIEMIVGVGVLVLLALMLNTGLNMAKDSYRKMVAESETQLLLSTLSDLISGELRYARDVVTTDTGVLERYTSVNYGRNTKLTIDDEGQLRANDRRMLTTGAYGNGAYRIDQWSITYDADGLFEIRLKVTGLDDISNETSFFVRCLNKDEDQGGNT